MRVPAALCLGLFLAACGAALSACDWTEREGAGAYQVRRTSRSFGGHTASHTELFLEGHRIASAVSDWAVDPRDGRRIVYACRDPEGRTGTFLHDATSKTSRALDTRAVTLGSMRTSGEPGEALYGSAEVWSPDARHLVLEDDIARPRVVDAETLASIDLSDAVSRGGRRIELIASGWSPDGNTLAVILQPEGYNRPDRDLVAITPATLAVEYVASMRGNLPLWTRRDYRWDGGTLIAASVGHHGPIFVKAPEELTWTAGRPR